MLTTPIPPGTDLTTVQDGAGGHAEGVTPGYVDGSGEWQPLVVDGSGNLGVLPIGDVTSVFNRYGGGKSAVTAQVTNSGNTTVLTPTSGHALRIYWVSAFNDPDQLTTPLITISLGVNALYKSYAISHWEIFEGAVDESLVVNLDNSGDVALTIHYLEL